MEEPRSKLSKLRELWDAGDRVGALRIAAKFPQLGEEKEAIQAAWAAFRSPDFYRQIKKDPDRLLTEGFEALKRRYSL